MLEVHWNYTRTKVFTTFRDCAARSIYHYLNTWPTLFNYTHQQLHIYICIYIYVLFKKSKIYIKALKTLLHVSITRSSSGSLYCSLLKLKFKTFSELLRYVNLVLW